MTHRRVRDSALFLFVMIGFTHVAAADPLTITSGFYRLNSNDGPVFEFRGQLLRVPGFNLTVPEGISPFEDCLSCSAGASIRLGTHVQERTLAETRASAEVEGVTWGSVYPLFYSGDLLFESSTVTAPPAGEGLVELVRPFTMRGMLMTFASSDRTGEPLFTAEFRGRGLAHLLLAEGERGTYDLADLTYRFEANTPVPEPATMALLGSGLAGLLLRRARNRGRFQRGR